MSERKGEHLLQKMTKVCVLCEVRREKDEMYRIEIDEPGAFEWVCEDCYEEGQS